ncbi:aldo/keto reductase [Deltaproteobacteria bacterium]|nr:aldo/keto reductase [Deltaproteobacteria bacterium]
MRTIPIKKGGFDVTVVSLGTLSMGGDEVWGPSEEAESIRTIHRAMDLGISFFDTAAFYGFGRSETILGKAMAGRRDKYIISTKCGLDWDTGEGSPFTVRNGYQVTTNLSAKGIRRSLENSLRRLNIDYVDICYTHRQSVPPVFTPIEETMTTLVKMKEEGKLRCIGVSNVTMQQLKEYIKWGQVDIVQEYCSMLNPTCRQALNEHCLANDIMFHCYSVFERGLLTGAYTMDSKVTPGDPRNEWSAWYQPAKRKKVIDLIASWEPLREKYNCAQSALTVAWTLQQAPNLIVVDGSRRVATIEKNAQGGNFLIEKNDLAAMNIAVSSLLKEEGII